MRNAGCPGGDGNGGWGDPRQHIKGYPGGKRGEAPHHLASKNAFKNSCLHCADDHRWRRCYRCCMWCRTYDHAASRNSGGQPAGMCDYLLYYDPGAYERHSEKLTARELVAIGREEARDELGRDRRKQNEAQSAQLARLERENAALQREKRALTGQNAAFDTTMRETMDFQFKGAASGDAASASGNAGAAAAAKDRQHTEAEQRHKKKQRIRRGRGKGKRAFELEPGQESEPGPAPAPEEKWCSTCGRDGHSASECPSVYR